MLTQRQREVYEFVLSYVDSHGYPPTVREIGEAVGLASPSTVHAHLANLERAGYLRRDPTKPRALELTRRERTAAGATVSVPDVGEVRVLPLVGEIAAGGPLLAAEENVEEHLAVPDTLARGEEFLLRVKGDSMIEAGILEGDYVVVQRQQTAKDGDIVVALAGQDEATDEATVKRFFRESGRVPAAARELHHEAALPWSTSASCKVVSSGGSAEVTMEAVTPSTAPSTRSSWRSCAAPAWSAWCGEFVLHKDGAAVCAECGSGLRKRENRRHGTQAG